MARHDRTPYFTELGHVRAQGYGVNADLLNEWAELLMHNRLVGNHDAHASCECRSYSEHTMLNRPNSVARCWLPLATVLAERHLVDAYVAAELTRRCPWLTPGEVTAIMHRAWPPGQQLP